MTQSVTGPIIILGGGGHARVVIDMLCRLNAEILGFTDPDPLRNQLMGVTHLGSDAVLDRRNPEQVELANGLGNVGMSSRRREVYLDQRQKGFSFPPLIHDSAVVAESADVGKGSQIMAGAVLQPNVQIGENVIINTNATVDHDCIIGDHVHIAPGATISGTVGIEERSFVGAGATIIDDLDLGSNTVVGAGAVVVRDVPSGTTVTGVPARPRN
ncbi:UDP-perosamine 4-acetyltransferase [Salinibacter ruber]|uniref:acetyltransferase n=1 Tax=Salinibacter ruber TaxID=146919 RepID=UPI00216A6CF1|nr:UDP-perosamine 4-acetyltransferase [Salinibacter ruber]